MGIIDKLKRSLNIGGCGIEVLFSRPDFPQGTAVKGKIVLKGGSIEQKADSLDIELVEFWTVKRGKHSYTEYRSHGHISYKDVDASPGTEQEFGFSFNLPSNARLTGAGSQKEGWMLKVALDVPNAIDPTCTRRVRVSPAEEFMAVAQACEALGFSLDPKSFRWNKTDFSTRFRMIPSDVMKLEFDYMEFVLLQQGSRKKTSWINGKIIFNLQEKSFKDYLKAVFMMDRVVVDVRFGIEQIFLADGSVNTAEIVNNIKPHMDKIIESRNEYLEKTPQESAAGTSGKGASKPKAAPKAPEKPEKKTPQRELKEMDPKRLDY